MLEKMDEVIWGQRRGGSFEGRGSTGDKSIGPRGHARTREGVLLRSRGQLRTWRQNWKRVKCRLRIQDLMIFQRFPSSFVPAPFIDCRLLKILTEKVESLSTSPRGPRRPAPYNGIFSTVSHTFTILISNFPQRWNKYFTETLAVINPIWKKIENGINLTFIVFRPMPRIIANDKEILICQFSSEHSFHSFVRNSSVSTRASKRIVTDTWRSLSHWVSHKLEPSQCCSLTLGGNCSRDHI